MFDGKTMKNLQEALQLLIKGKKKNGKTMKNPQETLSLDD